MKSENYREKIGEEERKEWEDAQKTECEGITWPPFVTCAIVSP